MNRKIKAAGAAVGISIVAAIGFVAIDTPVDKNNWNYNHSDCKPSLYKWRNEIVQSNDGAWFDEYNDVWDDKFEPYEIDLDHRVPKIWAFERINDKSVWEEFKCDTENIVFTSPATNRSKGARLPDQWVSSSGMHYKAWMPPDEGNHDEFCDGIHETTEKYDLPAIDCD